MAGKGTQLDVIPTDDGFRLIGEVDGQTAPTLAAELSSRLRDTDTVRLDVRSVEFMDSSGLRVLLAASDQARGRGGDVVLVGPTPAVLRLFELSHLSDHFTVEVPDAGDATATPTDDPS